MVRTWKEAAGSGREGRRSPSADGPTTDRLNYTSSDAEHFERLAALSHGRSDATGPAGVAPAAAGLSVFAYSESDIRAFERLMEPLGDRRGRRQPIKQGVQTASAGTGYSESDHRLFDELMSVDRFGRAAASDSGTRRQAPVEPAESAFRYSRQDLAEFQKIMPDATTADENQRLDRSGRPSPRDRDVGHIRIVDFDKERTRRKTDGRRGDGTIKIRYFD